MRKKANGVAAVLVLCMLVLAGCLIRLWLVLWLSATVIDSIVVLINTNREPGAFVNPLIWIQQKNPCNSIVTEIEFFHNCGQVITFLYLIGKRL